MDLLFYKCQRELTIPSNVCNNREKVFQTNNTTEDDKNIWKTMIFPYSVVEYSDEELPFKCRNMQKIIIKSEN